VSIGNLQIHPAKRVCRQESLCADPTIYGNLECAQGIEQMLPILDAY